MVFNICFSILRLLIELYNVVHGNKPNSEEMDIAVNVCEDNAKITGETKTIKCVAHERITQVIMAQKLSVDHEMVAEVAQLQIIEQVFMDIYCDNVTSMNC